MDRPSRFVSQSQQKLTLCEGGSAEFQRCPRCENWRRVIELVRVRRPQRGPGGNPSAIGHCPLVPACALARPDRLGERGRDTRRRRALCRVGEHQTSPSPLFRGRSPICMNPHAMVFLLLGTVACVWRCFHVQRHIGKASRKRRCIFFGAGVGGVPRRSVAVHESIAGAPRRWCGVLSRWASSRVRPALIVSVRTRIQ